MIQTPRSDIDFYERKIFRLEGDIAALHEELNTARTRLRTAEDFQIKYELLLKQSNQQNARLKQIEQRQRERFEEIMNEQIKINDEKWKNMLNSREQQWKKETQEKVSKLNDQITQLRHKNYQMSNKCQQAHIIVLKNKKLLKDIDSLEEAIQENRLNAERQKEEQLKQLKETLTQKYKQKHDIIKNQTEDKIVQLQKQCLSLATRLKENQLQTKVNTFKQESQIRNPALGQKIEGLSKDLEKKSNIIEEQMKEKRRVEEEFLEEKKQLKNYVKVLENKIFQIEKKQGNEIDNMKNRMVEIRKAEIEEIKNQMSKNQSIFRQEKNRWEALLLERGDQIQKQNKERQATITRVKDQKRKYLQKIAQLKDRLKYYEQNKEIGETEKLINSLKDMENREDKISDYEHGIVFLERQMRKLTTKLQKKNLQVNNLTKDINDVREQTEKQVSEIKSKYHDDKLYYEKRIDELQEKVKELTSKMLKKEREYKHGQNQLLGSIAKYNSEIKSLRNLNNDLQRDYNRILESKKAIEKSYRQERQRSVTSKSEVAVAKQQRWLELQRQKNQLQVIYKERQEQLKSNYDIELTEMKTERDHFKQQSQIIKQENKHLKNEMRKKNPDFEKQNKLADYNKKLATLNLQIALTQNIYKSLMEAKARQRSEKSEKQMSFQAESLGQHEDSIPDIINQIRSYSDNEEPMEFDLDEKREDMSPTFKFPTNGGDDLLAMSFKPRQMEKE